MAFVTPTDVTVGSVLTASKYNQEVVENVSLLPRGVLFHSGTLTSAFNTASTHTNYQTRTGMSGSVTYVADRYIRCAAVMRLIAGGGLQGIKVQFRRGSTVLVQNFADTVALSATSANVFVFEWVFAGPSTGATETFDVQIAAGASNTQVSDSASATFPSLFYVQDMGAV